MNISELLIPELERETKLTETFLNRVPKDKLEWSPHEKSRPLGTLCAHLVELYFYISDTMDNDTLDFATFEPPQLTTIDDMLAKLPELAATAAQSLGTDNESYQQTWTMKNGDKVLGQMPRYTAIRLNLNEILHHRAQLGVYLRLLDVPVPATYGPSADES